MANKGGSLLLEVLSLLHSSNSWLLTLQDIAPIIGLVVMSIIVLVIFIVLVKWYRYWVKKGLEEYEKVHGKGVTEKC